MSLHIDGEVTFIKCPSEATSSPWLKGYVYPPPWLRCHVYQVSSFLITRPRLSSVPPHWLRGYVYQLSFMRPHLHLNWLSTSSWLLGRVYSVQVSNAPSYRPPLSVFLNTVQYWMHDTASCLGTPLHRRRILTSIHWCIWSIFECVAKLSLHHTV